MEREVSYIGVKLGQCCNLYSRKTLGRITADHVLLSCVTIMFYHHVLLSCFTIMCQFSYRVRVKVMWLPSLRDCLSNFYRDGY